MKKNILLLLTTITIITAYLLTGCSNPLLLPGDGSDPKGNGSVQFSWISPEQTGSDCSASRANCIKDAVEVVITVESTCGEEVLCEKRVKVNNFEGGFISEPLSLKAGSYRLTDYLVLDKEGNAIFAAPKAGSKGAQLVESPLPINFTIYEDKRTVITPQIVDVSGVKPADFGYKTFNFNDAKLLNFLISVMVYDSTQERLIRTQALLEVCTKQNKYSFPLCGITNKVSIKEINESYKLTIKKEGYESHIATYTYAELKEFCKKELVVTLSKKEEPVNNVITFADPGLEAAVREAINKCTGDIYPADVARLTTLYARSKHISNLSGIEQLTSLEALLLDENSISDITPLSKMTKITFLYLDYNKIVDITPLSAMTKMTYLNISHNNIADITALSKMTKMTHLNLYNNSITDLTPLSKMTSLKVLYSSKNRISDITPLSSIKSLTYLGLHNNSITDITAISTMTNLTGLYLYNNSITDITPLVNNSGINYGDHVNLQGNPLNAAAQNTHIPVLKARGVNLYL